MIQRIYIYYLLLLQLAFYFFLFRFDLKDTIISCKVYTIILGLSTALTLLVLFPIKRQNQFVVGRLNIILNLNLLFVYRSLNLSGETPAVSRKVLGCFYLYLLSYFSFG
jgi:hypothetical protein